jgi:hypothetical protein
MGEGDLDLVAGSEGEGLSHSIFERQQRAEPALEEAGRR